MLAQALKEWAAVCGALASGEQILLLRKGGLIEQPDGFRVEHTQFWLLPTYLHQQDEGLKPEAKPLLDEAVAQRPPAGVIRLSHYARVAGVYHVRDLMTALLLDHWHVWSDRVVRQRFNYRAPGLFIIPLRVFRMPTVYEIEDSTAYAGCKSWVTFESALPTEGADPVVAENDFVERIRRLEGILRPVAWA